MDQQEGQILLPAPGSNMLLAVLEQEIHSLMRQKLQLQTDLQMLSAGLVAANNIVSQAEPNSRDSLVSVGAATGALLQLQQLQIDCQHAKAALAQLLQADNEEIARLHCLMAKCTTCSHSMLAGQCRVQQDQLQHAVDAAALLEGVHPQQQQPRSVPGAASASNEGIISSDSSSSRVSFLGLLHRQQQMLAQLLYACNMQRTESSQQPPKQISAPESCKLMEQAAHQAKQLQHTLLAVRQSLLMPGSTGQLLQTEHDAQLVEPQQQQHHLAHQQEQQTAGACQQRAVMMQQRAVLTPHGFMSANPAPLYVRGTLDAAGNPITSAAAANAAAVITAAAAAVQQRQRQQQRHSCAFCREAFPSADAFWAHCVMPHHMLQLLIRLQAATGQGLLGLPPLHGWWRKPLATTAAAVEQDVAGTAAVASGAVNFEGRGSRQSTMPYGDQRMREQQLPEQCMSEQYYANIANEFNSTTALLNKTVPDAAGSGGQLFTAAVRSKLHNLAQSTAGLHATAAKIVDAVSSFAGVHAPSLPSAHAPEQQLRDVDQPQMQEHHRAVKALALSSLLTTFQDNSRLYLEWYAELEDVGLPVPVPQGASEAIAAFWRQLQHQLETWLAEQGAHQQLPALLPQTPPALQVWMDPGVHVLPPELLLRLADAPAAAAAAEVMLGLANPTGVTGRLQEQLQAHYLSAEQHGSHAGPTAQHTEVGTAGIKVLAGKRRRVEEPTAVGGAANLRGVQPAADDKTGDFDTDDQEEQDLLAGLAVSPLASSAGAMAAASGLAAPMSPAAAGRGIGKGQAAAAGTSGKAKQGQKHDHQKGRRRGAAVAGIAKRGGKAKK